MLLLLVFLEVRLTIKLIASAFLFGPYFPLLSFIDGDHDEEPTSVPIFGSCLFGHYSRSGLSEAGVTGFSSENFGDVVQIF